MLFITSIIKGKRKSDSFDQLEGSRESLDSLTIIRAEPLNDNLYQRMKDGGQCFSTSITPGGRDMDSPFTRPRCEDPIVGEVPLPGLNAYRTLRISHVEASPRSPM